MHRKFLWQVNRKELKNAKIENVCFLDLATLVRRFQAKVHYNCLLKFNNFMSNGFQYRHLKWIKNE